MKKFIITSTCLIAILVSFTFGFITQKILDNKKFIQIYKAKENIENINEKLIEENKFISELNDKLLNNDNPITAREKECLQKANSTADSLNCNYTAENEWENEINKYLKLLQNSMSKEEYKLIKKNQNLWLSENNSSNKIINEFIFNNGGTMYYQVAASERLEKKKQRAEFLKFIYDIYTYEI